MFSYSSVAIFGVFGIALLAVLSGVKAYPFDGYEEDSDFPKEPREFMIPYPRLGRYMDYAVLKVLAEYLKDNYNYDDLVQYPKSTIDQSGGDVLLQRDLRDMKGKGYGIPIPRVGKRSPSSGGGEQMPPPGVGLGNESVRKLLADILRASGESKRETTSSRLMQFKPRVGRADRSMPKYANWAPVPRVGKRR